MLERFKVKQDAMNKRKQLQNSTKDGLADLELLSPEIAASHYARHHKESAFVSFTNCRISD